MTEKSSPLGRYRFETTKKYYKPIGIFNSAHFLSALFNLLYIFSIFSSFLDLLIYRLIDFFCVVSFFYYAANVYNIIVNITLNQSQPKKNTNRTRKT